MQHMEIKNKSGMVDIMWFSFAGSYSSSCADFMTFGIFIRYGCTIKFLIFEIYKEDKMKYGLSEGIYKSFIDKRLVYLTQSHNS